MGGSITHQSDQSDSLLEYLDRVASDPLLSSAAHQPAPLAAFLRAPPLPRPPRLFSALRVKASASSSAQRLGSKRSSAGGTQSAQSPFGGEAGSKQQQGQSLPNETFESMFTWLQEVASLIIAQVGGADRGLPLVAQSVI